jgi:hypothetical protein
MKIMAFLVSLFWKRKNRRSIFSEAISEAIKDLFKEMGYRINDNGKKK